MEITVTQKAPPPGAQTTPLMRQYWDIKSAHMDKVLLFRMGDFFEMFHDDAVTAAPIVGITLTKRNQKAADETPMCGVPHHSVAGPINKLLRYGLRVAICDQIEDPKLAKGIVRRAVTRILSPGMVFDSETLDQAQPCYMASYDGTVLALLDATTGEAFFFDDIRVEKRLLSLLQILSPAEVVVSSKIAGTLQGKLAWVGAPLLTVFESDSATAALRDYAVSMQGAEILKTLRPFEKRTLHHRLELPPTALKHLEIFETYRGQKKGSLLHSIDRTKTSAGARRLRQWLAFPLASKEDIDARLDQVETWTSRPEELRSIRSIFAGMGDIERRLGRLSTPTCNGRDLVALAQSLQAGIEASALTDDKQTPMLSTARQTSELILRTISDEPPISVREGHVIRAGFSKDLDELILLTTDSAVLLQELERREKERTGIPSLKVKYNNVFGYFIEITNTHKAKVPADYRRKQTLASAERFITDELEDLERKVLSARQRRSEMEFELFQSLRTEVLEKSAELLKLAGVWSELDVVTSLAWLAVEHNFRRPVFFGRNQTSSNQHPSIELMNSRHPVIEQELSAPFVPNDIHLTKGECLLLTGPNMAGKSTLMRQVAVCAILAQMGSFVPAESAKLPLFDRIFTRIGASDSLTEGLSTFMVEMKETAEMLRDATPDSLLILDEIGRGTSTFDGLSLAQSILEYILEETHATVLFATHYHELTQLEAKYQSVQNAHMGIREKNGTIAFLHTLTKGPANKSYGVHVARLAGLPNAITARAQTILQSLEQNAPEVLSKTNQLSLFLTEKPTANVEHTRTLIEEIRNCPIESTTPLEALRIAALWRERAQDLDLDL